jgi:hypothetical protein
MSNRSRRTPSKPRGAAAPPTRSVAPLLIVGPIVGLGLGIWLLGIVWPVDPDTETALIYGGVSGLFSGLLGGAAAAGSATMSPKSAWVSPIVGVLFAVGFTGLVLASMGSDSAPWMLIGVSAIAACVVWFYVLGMVSGVIPPLFVNRYGTWSAPLVGVVLIIVGVTTGSPEAMVIGILTIAAWAGILIGSLLLRAQTTNS